MSVKTENSGILYRFDKESEKMQGTFMFPGNYRRIYTIHTDTGLPAVFAHIVIEYETDYRGPIALVIALDKKMKQTRQQSLVIAQVGHPVIRDFCRFEIAVGQPDMLDLPIHITFTMLDNSMIRHNWSHTIRGSTVYDIQYFLYHDTIVTPEIELVLVERNTYFKINDLGVMINLLKENMEQRLLGSQLLESDLFSRDTEILPDLFLSPDGLAKRQDEWDRELPKYLLAPLGQMVGSYSIPFYSYIQIGRVYLDINHLYENCSFLKVNDTTRHGEYWEICIGVSVSIRHSSIKSYSGLSKSDAYAFMCGKTHSGINTYICQIPSSAMSVDDVNAGLRMALKEKFGPMLTAILGISPNRQN